MTQIFHNSHDLKYRRPFGAAVISSSVTISLEAPSSCISCHIRLWETNLGETLIPMYYNKSKKLFSADIKMPSYGVLLWYFFIITKYDGSQIFYGSDGRNLGGIGKEYSYEPPSWQITVYKPDRIPEWYRNAIVYQIFPDRFFRGEKWEEFQEKIPPQNNKNGPRRYLRPEWNEIPCYTKNADGEVTEWDFYGGNLSGIEEKLLYLKSLGVSVLYLNPIFKSPSNHKYDTSDYMTVDSGFGGNDALFSLIKSASELGINIILDGVFSHTGADSIYFNKYGNFDSIGAFQSKASPYYNWYNFEKFPDKYDCWWGVQDLPNVNETESSYSQFIYNDENSVIKKWLRTGIKGWRLDVADELPDSFIKGIRNSMRESGDDFLLLGEVWEDASHKFSHGQQREYLYGDELQSIMNYPFRNAVIQYILNGNAEDFRIALISLMENYPPEYFYSNLNLIGSHDTKRIITVLGEAPEFETITEKRDFLLSDSMYGIAKKRLILISLIQFTIPGVPCIYYGDETGMQGYEDPFNRAAYPWGREDRQLIEHFRFIAHIRNEYPLLKDGKFIPLTFGKNIFGCLRQKNGESILLLVNPDKYNHETISVNTYGKYALDLLHTLKLESTDGAIITDISPLSSALIYFSDNPRPKRATLPRASGILCHVTSVPSHNRKPVFGDDMYKFIDFLHSAGQKLWQILPLNPPDIFGSPYTSQSAFAGNPQLINKKLPEDMSKFNIFAEKNNFWLEDFALYSVLRSKFGTAWQYWPEKFRDRIALDNIKQQFTDEIFDIKIEQYLFFSQWNSVREYANSKNIQIIGDLPLFISSDSADVWAHRNYFILDENGFPVLTAGVPPDDFSLEGQNWNTPIYNWQNLEKDSFSWWKKRLSHCSELYNYTRLDHFRGLSAMFSIKSKGNAKDGVWLFGPGMSFFKNIKSFCSSLIAEDLGILDRNAYNLLELSGLAGMNIWQFHSCDMVSMNPCCAASRVFYTGTHDNETLLVWCKRMFPKENAYLKAHKIIETLFASEGGWVILPLQDVFLLGNESRMNTPGISTGNWNWQADLSLPFDKAADYLNTISKKYKR